MIIYKFCFKKSNEEVVELIIKGISFIALISFEQVFEVILFLIHQISIFSLQALLANTHLLSLVEIHFVTKLHCIIHTSSVI